MTLNIRKPCAGGAVARKAHLGVGDVYIRSTVNTVMWLSPSNPFTMTHPQYKNATEHIPPYPPSHNLLYLRCTKQSPTYGGNLLYLWHHKDTNLLWQSTLSVTSQRRTNLLWPSTLSVTSQRCTNLLWQSTLSLTSQRRTNLLWQSTLSLTSQRRTNLLWQYTLSLTSQRHTNLLWQSISSELSVQSARPSHRLACGRHPSLHTHVK